MKIELTPAEAAEFIRALLADEKPPTLSDVQKEIISEYSNATAYDPQTFYPKKNNRPKAACAL